MERHVSFGHLVAQRQAHENLRWNAVHSQGRIILEAKTSIERRIADQDAALSPQATNLLQSFINECLTDSLLLKSRKDGHRPETKPCTILAVDLDRREGDVAHDLAI